MIRASVKQPHWVVGLIALCATISSCSQEDPPEPPPFEADNRDPAHLKASDHSDPLNQPEALQADLERRAQRISVNRADAQRLAREIEQLRKEVPLKHSVISGKALRLVRLLIRVESEVLKTWEVQQVIKSQHSSPEDTPSTKNDFQGKREAALTRIAEVFKTWDDSITVRQHRLELDALRSKARGEVFP